MTIPWAELRSLWKIALPLVAAFLAEFLMFLTSKLVIGKLGYQELAAVGIASDLSIELVIVLMGLLSVIGVLIAEADGANRKSEVGYITGQGLMVAGILGVGASLLIWHLPTMLELLGQDPIVVELSTPYAHHLAPFALAVLLFSVLRTFVTALSSTGIVLLVTVLAVGINYLLTTALVHGKYGFPAMGLSGAGLSLTLANWLMLTLLLGYVYLQPRFREYRLFPMVTAVDPAVCKEILVLGIPVAGLVILEAGLFIAVSVLSGVLGTDTLAAYQVIMGWVAIPFVVSLGIANATLVRVANGIGRRNYDAARLSGLVGIACGVFLITALVIVPLTMPNTFVNWFLSPDDPGYSRVATLVRQLLIIVAFFQVFDGLQVISAYALRGLRDTLVPLWAATFGYWVVGIGGGSLLAFWFEQGAVGLWLGMAGGLTVTGTLLTARFLRLSNRRIREEFPPFQPDKTA